MKITKSYKDCFENSMTTKLLTKFKKITNILNEKFRIKCKK